MRFLKFTIICLACAIGLRAETISVADNDLGSHDGTATNNAHGLAWFQTGGNWASPKVSGKIGPGDTVQFFGQMTNRLGGISGSGDAANPITFLWLTNSGFVLPTVTNNGGFFFSGFSTRSNLIFDATALGTNIAINITNNGDGLGFTNGITGFTFTSGAKNVTFKGVNMRGIYQRFNKNTSVAQCTWFDGVGSSITITNCLIGEMYLGLKFNYGGGVSSNLTIAYNTFVNYNHGWEISAAGNSGHHQDTFIHHNQLLTGDAYETVGADVGLHRDPMFFFNDFTNAVVYQSNTWIYANYIKSGSSPAAGNTAAGTAAIYWECYDPNAFWNTYVYDNIVELAAPLTWSGGGGQFSVAGHNGYCWNNTGLGWNSGGNWGGNGWSMNGTNCYGWNNLIVGTTNAGGAATYANIIDTTGQTQNNATKAQMLSGVTTDYNVYEYLPAANGFDALLQVLGTHGTTWTQDFTNTIPNINSIFGGALSSQWEVHSTTNNFSLTGYMPTSAGVTGTNLTSFMASIGASAVDFYGNARPSSGSWTVGAVEYSAGGGGTSGGGGASPVAIAGRRAAGRRF